MRTSTAVLLIFLGVTWTATAIRMIVVYGKFAGVWPFELEAKRLMKNDAWIAAFLSLVGVVAWIVWRIL